MVGFMPQPNSDPYAGVATATPQTDDPYASVADNAADVPLYSGGPNVLHSDDPGTNAMLHVGGGANSFMTHMLSMPTMLLDKLAEVAGAPAKFVQAGQRADAQTQNELPGPPPDKGLIDRAEDAAGGGIAATALTMGAAPLLSAATGGEATIAGNALAQLAPKTGAGLVGETALGGTSGAGAAVGGEVGQDVGGDTGRAVGELGGALVGGGLLPIGPMSAGMILAKPLLGLAKRLYNSFSKTGLDNVATNIAGSTLRAGLRQPGNLSNLRDAQGTVTEVNQGGGAGFNPSVAERTGSPSLVAEQQQLERSASGEQLESLAGRQQQNLDALKQYRNVQTPEGGPLTTVIDTVKGGVRAISNELERVASAITSKLPNFKVEKAGAVLQGRLQQLKQAVRNSFTERGNALKLDQTDVSTQFVDTMSQMMHEVDPTSVFRTKGDLAPDLATRVAPILKAHADYQTALEKWVAGGSKGKEPVQPPPVKFSDLKFLRERLSDGIIDNISGANPNKAYVRQLVIAKQHLDNMLLNLPLGQQYKQFINDYFDHYVSRFEQGPAFKMQQKDGHGFVQTLPEKVAGMFADGTFTNAQQFKTAFGDDPRALVALKASVLDDFRNTAVKNGVLDIKAANKWTAQHDGLLRVYPQLKATPQDLMERQIQLNQVRESTEDMILHKQAAGLITGKTTDEAFIQEAIKNPTLGKQLLSRVAGNPDAQASLRRYLFQNAPDGATLDDYLNSPLVKGTLSPQHAKALRTIFNAKNMMARVAPAKGAASDLSPLGAVQSKLGFGIPQAASRFFAIVSGRTSERYVLTEGAVRLFNRLGMARAKGLLEQALYDPQLAIKIANDMKYAGAKNYDPIIPFRPWLVNYGLLGPQIPGAPDTSQKQQAPQ